MYKIIMIIQCIKCNKKFDVNSDLIPKTGRTIQCGSCNHVWFFQIKKEDYITNPNEDIINQNTKSSSNKDLPKKSKNKKDLVGKIDNIINTKETALVKYDNKNNFTLIKFFRYILVLFISLISIIVLLDTLKYPLNNYFPNLELLLFNFYESLKDIYLFTKDLIL
jgi:predicted Zn finger-like uncharacterized protein